ncbi:response regulator [Vacuolonema iberomarrocanum]|uniref:response regulator n=1 Tax=Vacuolonema iberomarrocanum TaxID=3454632 RepID=UPI0019F5D966|nr:response regulator [filamentous cyanobacterium LEGE 07170]
MGVSDRVKPKILVVDDETDNLDLLYRTFYREYTVLRAESGAEALAILKEEGEVAVIISDQRMPSMSGTEFLSLTAREYPDIIRIILTGYTDVGDLVDAINAGKVFKYVTKPWDDEELKVLVRQAVDTHNVLKTRTQDLQRTLRQETLLNAITNTIRSAPSYRQILQTIVETVGHMFEVDCCIIRPFPGNPNAVTPFIYQSKDAVIAPEKQAYLLETVWAMQDVMVLNDVASDPRLDTNPFAMGEESLPTSTLQAFAEVQIASSVIVPLTAQQDLVAVLALHQLNTVRQWQDDEVQLALMVADQAALALSQAYAYEQVRELARRESLVNTITSAIRSSLDPQEIFAAITKQLGRALKTDGCALSLWTEEDEYVQCVGLYDTLRMEGEPINWSTVWADDSAVITPLPDKDSELNEERPQLPQSLVPIEGNPVLQRLLETQEPVEIGDLQAHPEFNTPDLPLRSPARALLVVPLLYDGKIIGSISLRQAHIPRAWEAEEVDLALAVASQAAIAVQQSRLYQKTRQQAEQLMEMDRQKTEFFQNISHEFRTPLTLTLGPLESAVAQGQGLSSDQSKIALRNSRRLLRLVNQLLDLQRLDAGRMQPSFRPVNLLDFVLHVVEAFRPYCDRRQISLISYLRDCPPVYLDVERFDKVLYNLLSNAMKFTPSGGSIHISVYPSGDRCQIKVQDSGIGIREDQLPYLFERFRQADGSTNRTYEGSGLGLALVKELVELHGGRVHVESVYGEGSTFTLWLQTGFAHLPAEQVIEVPAEIESSRATVELADVEADPSVAVLAETPTVEAIAPPADVPAEFTPSDSETALPQILVVDDNSDMRSYVSGILQDADYGILTARNGADAWEMLQAQTPDLIITDLMMPVMSGLELIKRLRQHETLKGTPIVLVTAKADEETRIEGVEEGADGYLSKPFNARELLAEVRNLLALKANERRIAELNSYLTESVLKRFLPPSLVERAAQGELALDLRPEPRMITVLFSDIIGFTQLSNTLRSRRVAELLNEYLTEMTHAIFEHGGTIDKFMGDAILAIFGAPEEISPNEQVNRAITAARQMYRRLDDLNEQWIAQGLITEDNRVQFRCGIHQGTAVVGMFGGSERTDYTAIGPSVNIAARIQESAEPNSILVSAAVADYLHQDAITKFSPLHLKGVDETVLTFSIHVEHT